MLLWMTKRGTSTTNYYTHSNYEADESYPHWHATKTAFALTFERSLPPLSRKDYWFWHIFKGNFLVYIICLPLTNNINFNLYHILTLPIQLKNTESKFIFLLPEHEYLVMDIAKQYFARLRANKLTNFKSISSWHHVWRQT